jgi:RNA polymerase sigma factor (sigma-70 family)
MGNSEKKDFKTIIDGFRSNNEKILKEVYRGVFPKVRTHILKNSGDEAKAKDIFQEAFVACWQNVKENKLDGNGNLEGYLFTIAKNKWTDYLRSSGFRKTVRQDVISMAPHQEMEDNTKTEEDRELEIMKAALAQLGKGCKNLLTSFYFERKNMEEIAQDLGIGAASARNKKYRCMEHLRTLALKIKKNG